MGGSLERIVGQALEDTSAKGRDHLTQTEEASRPLPLPPLGRAQMFKGARVYLLTGFARQFQATAETAATLGVPRGPREWPHQTPFASVRQALSDWNRAAH